MNRLKILVRKAFQNRSKSVPSRKMSRKVQLKANPMQLQMEAKKKREEEEAAKKAQTDGASVMTGWGL